MKTGWRDASLTLRVFSRSNKQNFMRFQTPIDFKHKFHDSKRFANKAQRAIKLDVRVITTALPFYISRSVLMFIYIQLQVLE